MEYTRDTWAVDLPEGWMVEEAEECTAFYKKENGVGAFQVSTFYKEKGEVNKEELLEFSEAIKPEVIELAHLSGLKDVQQEEGDSIFSWWLRKGPELFFVSYICAVGDEDKEAVDREHIIQSLRQIEAV